MTPCVHLGGRTGQNSPFSGYGHVTYQIKGNDTCINMVAWGRLKSSKFNCFRTWSLHAPSTLRVGSNVITLFLKVVVLHTKLFRMDHRAPCKHIFCSNTHPRLWSKDQNIFFLLKILCHFVYQIKRNGT